MNDSTTIKNQIEQLFELATEYSKGIRDYYTTNGFDETSIDAAVTYATLDWLNDVRGWSIEEAADDLEYWKEKWQRTLIQSKKNLDNSPQNN